MNTREWDELMDQAARRPLTADELARVEAWLRREPSWRERWEGEEALTRCLAELPSAPVSSNFTSRVLAAVEAEAGRRHRGWLTVRWPGWMRRPAVAWAGAALVILSAAVVVVREREGSRSRLAASVAVMVRGVEVPVQATAVPEMWLDYEPIRLMSQSQPMADEELLAALR